MGAVLYSSIRSYEYCAGLLHSGAEEVLRSGTVLSTAVRGTSAASTPYCAHDIQYICSANLSYDVTPTCDTTFISVRISAPEETTYKLGGRQFT